MSGVWDEIEVAKELTRERITKDEEDVQSMMNTTTEKMVNSWQFDPKIQRKILCLILILVPRPDVAKFLSTASKAAGPKSNK